LMTLAGSAKFSRPDLWQSNFVEWGYPIWFTSVIGAVEVAGGSVPVVESVQQAQSYGTSQYALSDRGALVYMPGSGAAGAFRLVWVDRNSGQVEPLPFEPSASLNLNLSPDGRRVALEIRGDDGSWDIWIYDVERGGSRNLLTTEGTGNNRNPVWSPDGEWVFFQSDRGGNFDVWKRRADLSLEAEEVLDEDANVKPSSISADGERLLYRRGDSSNRDLLLLEIDSDREPEALATTAADEVRGQFSPDGRFVAFASDVTGQYEVYVRELSTGRTLTVSTSTLGGARPRWSQDSREIYYSTATARQILVAQVDTESFRASDPVELSDIVMRPVSNFAVTADGQRFLVTVPVDANVGVDSAGTTFGATINVILNWFEELKQRVPTGGR